MKRILTTLFFIVMALVGFSQSINLNDVVRANTLSPARTANALDAITPHTATGTDTYAVTILSGVLYTGSATYTTGDMFAITFTNANTSGTVTLNINSEGAIAVKDNEGNNTGIGDIVAGGTYILRYNGTNFRIVGATGGGGGGGTPGGSDTQVQFNNSSAFGGDADFTFTGGNTLNVDVAIVDAETFGSGWNGDNSVPTKNDAYDEIILKQSIINSAVALTDASSIDITGIKHTLASSSATRTFTISYTGDCSVIELTLSTTGTVYTFPATALCVSEGWKSGDNTLTLSGVSGDKYIITIRKIGSNYYVVGKNFGQ